MRSNHKAHPKCPHCAKPLYRNYETGARPRQEDPYRFCRNVHCQKHGARGIMSRRDALKAIYTEADGLEAPPPKRLLPRRGRAESLAELKTGVKARVVDKEDEKIDKIRLSVKQALSTLGSKYSTQTVMTGLAIALQETGNNEVALVLIAKHRLEGLGL